MSVPEDETVRLLYAEFMHIIPVKEVAQQISYVVFLTVWHKWHKFESFWTREICKRLAELFVRFTVKFVLPSIYANMGIMQPVHSWHHWNCNTSGKSRRKMVCS